MKRIQVWHQYPGGNWKTFMDEGLGVRFEPNELKFKVDNGVGYLSLGQFDELVEYVNACKKHHYAVANCVHEWEDNPDADRRLFQLTCMKCSALGSWLSGVPENGS